MSPKYRTGSLEMVMSLVLLYVLGFGTVLVVGFTCRNEDLDTVITKSHIFIYFFENCFIIRTSIL